MSISRLSGGFIYLGLVLAIATLSGCGKQEQAAAQTGGRGNEPAPVTIEKVQQRDMPVQIRVIGSVEAYSNVVVKSRVAGELLKVHVTPGQDAKAGDLLFEIDSRPFETALHEAEAGMDRDNALAKNAAVDATRMAGLVSSNAATREEADKAKYQSEAAQATVRADQAAVENARLQLAYAKIASPMDGRAGALLANQGNVIKSDDTQLLVLNQIEPIYVTFSIPEQDLPQVRKFSATTQPTVDVVVPTDEESSESGKLTFIDNQVDATTGTIRLRATFANKDRRLWPGQFVQTTLNLTFERGATVAPSRAIQNGQQGTYVWVVKGDSTVIQRPVIVRRSVGEESVIESGLQSGEQVVTDGQLRLTNNAKIQIKTLGPASAPATTAPAVTLADKPGVP